jgi:hypothetical protein
MLSPVNFGRVDHRNVFVVENRGKSDPFFAVFTNRKILLKWIQSEGIAYIEGSGNPKIIDSYLKLSRMLQKTPVLRIGISRPGKLDWYQVTKAPLIKSI